MALNVVERYQYIIHKLNELGVVSVNTLSEELKVSTVTIRKDLIVLESKGLLIRNHGGASSIEAFSIPQPRPLIDKKKSNTEPKRRIGKAAVSFLEENDTIIIASGTTVIEFAYNINPQKNLTVLSSTVDVSKVLSNCPGVEVIQLGGILRKSSNSVIGSFAEKMLSELTFNKLFLGIDGIDIEYGITTTSFMEASLNQVMIKASQQVIVLADSTKFGRKSFGKICGVEDVDIIITDKMVDKDFKQALENIGIKVITV